MTNIDDNFDEFDALFRKMLRQFFSGSPAFGRMMGETHRISPQAEQGTTPRMAESDEKEHRIERIDLDDRVIIVIDNCKNSDNPEAHIEGREVEVTLGEAASHGHEFEVPFAVDVEESKMTFRNGVVEITLVKSEKEDASSDFNEGLLKPE
ncbi:MAG: hypothetical protein KGY80_06355 [Candidatus Thorarchaeota archaeon]|nr:hypothetical protein [Candidatus Thorarchaeota archaeon]